MQKRLCSHLNGYVDHPKVVMARLGSVFGGKKETGQQICKKNEHVSEKVKENRLEKHYYPAMPTGEDGCATVFSKLKESDQTEEMCGKLRVVNVIKPRGMFGKENKDNSIRGYKDEGQRKKAIDEEMPYYKPNGDPILGWGTYNKENLYVEEQKWCTFEGGDASCDFVKANNPCEKHNKSNGVNPIEDSEEACLNELSERDEQLCEWK
ncbi:MAG: hypothetical protein AAF320_03750, partial [Myxococcota bacterium]